MAIQQNVITLNSLTATLLSVPKSKQPNYERNVSLSIQNLDMSTRIFVGTRPNTNTSTGTQGTVYWDNTNNYFYICVSTNSWIRFAANDVFNNSGGGD